MNKDFVMACELKSQYEEKIEPFLSKIESNSILRSLTPKSAIFIEERFTQDYPTSVIPYSTQVELSNIALDFLELNYQFENNRLPVPTECED